MAATAASRSGPYQHNRGRWAGSVLRPSQVACHYPHFPVSWGRVRRGGPGLAMRGRSRMSAGQERSWAAGQGWPHGGGDSGARGVGAAAVFGSGVGRCPANPPGGKTGHADGHAAASQLAPTGRDVGGHEGRLPLVRQRRRDVRSPPDAALDADAGHGGHAGGGVAHSGWLIRIPLSFCAQFGAS